MRPSSGFQTNVLEFNRDQQYIEFDGINLDASSLSDSNIVKINSGYLSDHAHHIRIQNAELIGAPANGGAPQGIIDVNTDGTALGGSEFINLTVHSVGSSDFSHAFYIQSGNNLVQGCNIYDFTGAGVHVYNGYGPSFSNNIVRNNVIHDGRAGASGQRHWGIIIANGSQNTKVYNNLIYGIPNQGGSSTGIFAYVGTQPEIYNNTVVQNGGVGIAVTQSTSGALVRNNISFGNGGSNYENFGSGTIVSNNLFDGTNPMFVDSNARNFRLQSGSPGVDAGTAIALVTTDLSGASRPQGRSYDIGAFELTIQSTAPAPPTGVRIVSN